MCLLCLWLCGLIVKACPTKRQITFTFGTKLIGTKGTEKGRVDLIILAFFYLNIYLE